VGMVVAIAGQGMALSSDYIIKVAPGISAKAAGVDPDTVADKTIVLSLIVGLTALIITFVMQRRTWRKPSPDLLVAWENTADHLLDPEDGNGSHGVRPIAEKPRTPAPVVRSPQPDSTVPAPTATATATVMVAEPADTSSPIRNTLSAKVFAVLVPVVYLGFIVFLLLGKFTSIVPPLKGGDAAAIVGGIAALILFAAAATNDKRNFLETSSGHVVDGLVFAFKAMGIVLPIAGFFFIGNGDFSGTVLGLPDGAQGRRLSVRPHQRRAIARVAEPRRNLLRRPARRSRRRPRGLGLQRLAIDRIAGRRAGSGGRDGSDHIGGHRADGQHLVGRRHPGRLVVADRGRRLRTGTGPRPRPASASCPSWRVWCCAPCSRSSSTDRGVGSAAAFASGHAQVSAVRHAAEADVTRRAVLRL
jgi:hypothetical protein